MSYHFKTMFWGFFVIQYNLVLEELLQKQCGGASDEMRRVVKAWLKLRRRCRVLLFASGVF